MGEMDRLLTALGAVAAATAVVASFALLFHVLDAGNGSTTSAATVIRVEVPGGTNESGQKAQPGHATVGAKSPGQRTRGAGASAGSSSSSSSGSAEQPTLAARPRRGTAFEIVRIREGAHVEVESEPNGSVVDRLGDKTEFGSAASYSVVKTKPGWLGVTTPDLPNGKLGWIARDPSRIEVYWTRYSLHADLDSRTLELRYGKKVVGRWSVTIGGSGTETPTGRYGVTDGVSFDESPYYGCCALALSGHQTHELPENWIGGNRLAIHGTPGTVGGAESLGCIRATDETMRFLFSRIPLGTPVFVSA